MIKIIHLSDLHFRLNWEESIQVVTSAFFEDLERRLGNDESQSYIVFSGDVVQAGSKWDEYLGFIDYFEPRLNKIGIDKSKRICLPGNHDVCTNWINSNLVTHEGIVGQQLGEKEFNDYISSNKQILSEKFNNFIDFEKLFTGASMFKDSIGGSGKNLNDGIGIFCSNSALLSSGGVKQQGDRYKDHGRLAIETRSLYKWTQATEVGTKILALHHPFGWLNNWSSQEIEVAANKNFQLVLSGHTHQQDVYHKTFPGSSVVTASAPPLFTEKNRELGYSIISICPFDGVKEIEYRQWTSRRSFVTGVNFSNTDDGKVYFKEEKIKNRIHLGERSENDFVDRYLTKKLNDALVSFSSQPIIWVEPSIHTGPENAGREERTESKKIDAIDIICSPASALIKAPPQFGLTCLALYMCREAWRRKEKAWVYLESKGLKPGVVEKKINEELILMGQENREVACIVMDSWSAHDEIAKKNLKKVCEIYPDIPVIVMESISDTRFVADEEEYPRTFKTLFLWAMAREDIRSIVKEYNRTRHFSDDSLLLKRVATDLEALNLHRTPLNCLTLLKVSEMEFEDSPVNRTEMIKRILFLLFNIDVVPTYKTRPDLKDCEYVLGRFCEKMLKENFSSFSRMDFLKTLNKFCEERVLDLEVNVVFDVLLLNNIIVKNNEEFCFKFSYWIYYFAAQRMLQDVSFAEFIFRDMRYTKYPEIIEFYTGIDRRRDDALAVMADDLLSLSATVSSKFGLPEGMNPYKFAKWTPSDEAIGKMHDEISDGVQDSKLPVALKDRYADKNYDPSKPYRQEAINILQEHSVLTLMQAVKAGSRALRNSDYVDPDQKRCLLGAILNGWEEVSKLLFVISPILAEHGRASIDGAGFVLDGDFGGTPTIRFNRVISVIPQNVVDWFRHDLFSKKMGPLLKERLIQEENLLTRHELILLIASERPRDWRGQIERYISEVHKNSFYLYDVYETLSQLYRYSDASPQTVSDLKFLIKKSLAKHKYGTANPGAKAVGKVPDEVLPARDAPDYSEF